jgi:hypothetical protein
MDGPICVDLTVPNFPTSRRRLDAGSAWERAFPMAGADVATHRLAFASSSSTRRCACVTGSVEPSTISVLELTRNIWHA